MDLAKKQEFARRFGKRLHLKKGGLVRRHYDSGGTILGGPSNPTNATTTGIGGIAQGLGLNASAANIQQGTNAAQLNNAYTGTQNALTNQNNLTSTLTPQAATAVQNQNELAQQEAAMAAGQGPNPAQAQLAQATGSNVANQAALMAGQRGASANPALMARQIAQQGASTQQQAAGQAATQEAQQQIAAQSNLANLAATQIGQTGQATTAQNTAEQNEQNILQNANTAANNAAVQMQSNINNVNANASQGVLGGVTNALSHVPVIGSLFEEGGEVGKDGISHGKHKLDFIHKMTKMGMEHYDGGGSVSYGPERAAPHKRQTIMMGPDVPGERQQAAPIAQSAAMTYQGSGTPSNTGSLGGDVAEQLNERQSYAGGGDINWGGAYTQPQQSASPNIEQTQLKQAKIGSNANDKKKPDQQTAEMNQNNTANSVAFNNMLAPKQNTTIGEGTAGSTSMGQSTGGGDVANLLNAYKGGNISEGPHKSHVANFLASGGKTKEVPAMVSSEEIYLSPEKVKEVIEKGANPMKIGHKFKGKAKVKNDSLKNDTIPVTLEEGGVIIPRHITTHKMAREKAELFVHKTMAKHRAGGKL